MEAALKIVGIQTGKWIKAIDYVLLTAMIGGICFGAGFVYAVVAIKWIPVGQ